MVDNALLTPHGRRQRQEKQQINAQTAVNVSTQNKYDVLTMDDDTQQEDTIPNNNAGFVNHQQPPRTKTRCPPITVYGKSVVDINKTMATLSIEKSEYRMRLSNGSIRIHINKKQNFTTAVEALRNANVLFYTHGTNDEIPVKYVLSGLSRFEVEDIREELSNEGIIPLDVKLLRVSKNGDDALYLVSFPRGSIRLQELQKKTSLFNVIIEWRHYTRKPTDAVQCFRCQKFGHGMRYCNLEAKCVKCGELHQTSECEMPTRAEVAGNNTQLREKIRCANCSQNHTANYKGCPQRKRYIEALQQRKEQLANRNTNISSAAGRRRSFTSSFVVSGCNFAEALKSNPTPTQTQQQLFTPDEFVNLARDLITRLSECRSKEMQFAALAELAIKYVYNNA